MPSNNQTSNKRIAKNTQMLYGTKFCDFRAFCVTRNEGR
jgi:hypothetical protein